MNIALELRDRAIATPVERKNPASPAQTLDRAQQAYGDEQYRALGHIVEQIGKSDRRLIAITSPVAGDGKTLTSLSLARAMSLSSEARILLVDADLRRGSLGESLGIARSQSAGLAGVISNPQLRLAAVTRKVPGFNFTVLPAGTCPAQPYETLRSIRAGELFAEAKASFDYVIVDAPPVVPVADVRVLSDWVDGFFMIVSAHRTPKALLDEALSAMEPQKVLGLIYNGDDLPISGRHRYYYSYGQEPPRGLLGSLMGR